ncbi:carbohydrate ABC transporter permease [Anaerocolumna xylanovorans]|uniref:Multiple sugar transport system permease protein n=1 Tax=Anaerocolumna xylanovorans DSM 12503 TaxID=1121345 RepID=A0A1M7Y5A9_9FIRM|nr:sugar ABC transporter permease [Anaerocolumna xylanovorans]SHO47547.1 multiple sugar transport system permease protein [Anaerocolumna xylanovorans DSM 12503]
MAIKMKKDTLARIGFTLPFLIPLLLFWIVPLFLAFGISFTDWDYISANIGFVGLDNYKDIFTDSDFLKALFNTFYFAVGTIPPTLLISFGLALLFENQFRGSKLFRSVIFSPWITPTVAVSMVWSWIYEPERGFANHLLGFFGIAPLSWLQDSTTAMLSVIIFTIWKSLGWTFLFYIGALAAVPKSTYEAAEIDGASRSRKLLHITIPLISPTTFFLFVVNLIQSIQVYDQIQIMTQGGPGGSTTTLLYMYYDKSFQNFKMGPANSIAMIILAIIVVLSLISNRISSRFVHYE